MEKYYESILQKYKTEVYHSEAYTAKPIAKREEMEINLM